MMWHLYPPTVDLESLNLKSISLDYKLRKIINPFATKKAKILKSINLDYKFRKSMNPSLTPIIYSL